MPIETTKVLFKKVFSYSPNGSRTITKQAGEVATLEKKWADSAIKSGAAEVYIDPKDETAPETAPDGDGDETKDITDAIPPETTGAADAKETAPKGDGKTGSKEDKSVKPGANKSGK